MSKTILFIGGGVESVPGIIEAKEMGLRVVVSDIDINAPGIVIADDYFIASTYDIDETVTVAENYNESIRNIDGVICVATDVPLTVAKVAESLGIPGISLESALLATDKLSMKKKFADDNILIPWFSSVDSVEDLKNIVADRGFPLVLKPVDSRGARGVLRLTNKVDLEWAFDQSTNHSLTERVMVEEFLTGPQVSTESIVVGGKTFTSGFSDRNYEYLERYSPFIIENGGSLPSHLSEKDQQNIRELVQKASSSMGMVDGVVKGDIVLHKEKPYVIELATRLSGGHFCTHEIPLNTGVNIVKQAILSALGEKLKISELTPLYQKYVAQRYLFLEPGRVTSISNVDDIAKREGIHLLEIRVKVGDLVNVIDSHPARAGVIITTGANRQEAIDIAISAIKDIKIVTSKIN